MPWGYFEIPRGYAGQDFRNGLEPTPPRKLNYNSSYVLVGCEPKTMFKPGTEPESLDFFWWDNSQLPHLRYPSPANPDALKTWSRLIHRGWATPLEGEVDTSHRRRVNRILQAHSHGEISDISDLWGGTTATHAPQGRRMLILPSSERCFREFYSTSQADWLAEVTHTLAGLGWTWKIRNKPSPRDRQKFQIPDEIQQGRFDCVLAHHSAGASEAVVTGTAAVTTSAWNPARSVSTPWEEFRATGEVKKYTQGDIDTWVTKTCAYTYHRSELTSLSWIKVHPDSKHLRSTHAI